MIGEDFIKVNDIHQFYKCLIEFIVDDYLLN